MNKTPSSNETSLFPESEFYTQLGVSAAKADVELAAKAITSGIFPNAFCRIIPDVFQNDPQYCAVSHSDGAGSKSILAYLKLMKTGRPDAFRLTAHDALVMNIDDVICSGITTGFTYVSVVNRNAHRIGGDVVSSVINGTLETIDKLREYGVEITFCGGETADVGDIVQTVLVDGALTGRSKRDQIVKNELIPGHVIVALSGHGPPASYETTHNSGIGSNGITLARRALLSAQSVSQFPEVANNNSASDEAYFGDFNLDDVLPGSQLNVIDALLSPTRTFAPLIHPFLQSHRSEISGLFHNTGGGQVKCLKAARGLHLEKVVPVPFPPIFEAIRKRTELSRVEMAKVFNLGWRMEIYCTGKAAESLISLAKSFNVEARVVGHVNLGTEGKNKLTLKIGDESATFES